MDTTEDGEMSPCVGDAAAADALGQLLDRPPYADPSAWRRFARKVADVPGGCRLWLGPPRDDGYGQFSASSVSLRLGAAVPALPPESATQPALFGDKLLESEPTSPAMSSTKGRGGARPWRAHRWAFVAVHGWIPGGQEVMHVCDEPLCVRPEHLVLGTTAENAWDRDAKGRLVHRGKNGVMRWGSADRRAQYGRSLAVHEALLDAIAEGVRPGSLSSIVERVAASGAGYDVALPGLQEKA